jgi:phage gpG-like protein
MYAGFHQFGTSKMPARPFFPSQTLPQNWERDILHILDSYLNP